jgi:hypothetical protein
VQNCLYRVRPLPRLTRSSTSEPHLGQNSGSSSGSLPVSALSWHATHRFDSGTASSLSSGIGFRHTSHKVAACQLSSSHSLSTFWDGVARSEPFTLHPGQVICGTVSTSSSAKKSSSGSFSRRSRPTRRKRVAASVGPLTVRHEHFRQESSNENTS